MKPVPHCPPPAWPQPLWPTLVAVADRIVPRDEWPGAVEAGALDYVMRQLSGDLRNEATIVEQGLAALEAEAQERVGRPLQDLDDEAMDAMLEAVERGEVRTVWPVDPAAWFTTVIHLVGEGFYADPANGGNRGAVSWSMIGYAAEAKRGRA